jgi:hypothetical protein
LFTAGSSVDERPKPGSLSHQGNPARGTSTFVIQIEA